MTETITAPRPSRVGRIIDGIFLHVGSLFSVLTYFVIAGGGLFSVDAVRRGLITALLVTIVYGTIAYTRRGLKQFDLGLGAMFALGTLASLAGITPIVRLFQHYSAAIVFATFGLVALVPVLLGREPFTTHYARRQTPAWQQKLSSYREINRVMSTFWAAVFFAGMGLCIWAPQDPRYTALYPNLLVFLVGIPANFWLPPLYLRLRPPPRPDAIEALILGMPFVFDRNAAANARATIQFDVHGSEAGRYYLQIADGRCRSFTGTAPSADLRIETPDTVWRRIAHGTLDGTQALAEGLYRVEGDFEVLGRFSSWFPSRR